MESDNTTTTFYLKESRTEREVVFSVRKNLKDPTRSKDWAAIVNYFRKSDKYFSYGYRTIIEPKQG